MLLVEDDDRVAAALLPALRRRGYEVGRAATGAPVPGLLPGFDVVLVDLGLPDVDGVQLCREIRAASDLLLLVVSARSEVGDRVAALQAGADDYLVKPYDIGELVARIEAVARRRQPEPARPVEPACFRLHDGLLEVDTERHEVRVRGAAVPLSRKEFQILSLIVSARGAVCSRERLLAQVWGRSWPGANRTLDVHIATLRTKLAVPELLRTVRGVGYRLGPEYVE